MFRKVSFITKVITLCLIAGIATAANLGGIASNLYSFTDILSKFMQVACIVVGIGLVMMAFTHFKIHRASPKLVPLDTPITQLILGLIVLSIPYLGQILGTDTSKEAAHKKAHEDFIKKQERVLYKK